jgi:hypothetical protein
VARFVFIDELEFAIMAVRWKHKADLLSARDLAEQLLRCMPRDKLAGLHAGLNEGNLHTRAFGEARGLCEQAAKPFRQGRPDLECLLWLDTGMRARKVNMLTHEGNDD